MSSALSSRSSDTNCRMQGDLGSSVAQVSLSEICVLILAKGTTSLSCLCWEKHTSRSPFHPVGEAPSTEILWSKIPPGAQTLTPRAQTFNPRACARGNKYSVVFLSARRSTARLISVVFRQCMFFSGGKSLRCHWSDCPAKSR